MQSLLIFQYLDNPLMKIPKSKGQEFLTKFTSSAPHEALKVIYDYLPPNLQIEATNEKLSKFQEFYKDIQKQLQEIDVLYKANRLHPRECQVIFSHNTNNIK